VTSAERTVSFDTPNGVSLYGGCAGTGSDPLAVLNSWDFETNETVLGGHIDCDVTETASSSRNAVTLRHQ
jgi:hypothetical protein